MNEPMAKARSDVRLVTPQEQESLSRAFTHALQIIRSYSDDCSYVAGEGNEYMVLVARGHDAVTEMRVVVDAVMATHKIVRGMVDGQPIKQEAS